MFADMCLHDVLKQYQWEEAMYIQTEYRWSGVNMRMQYILMYKQLSFVESTGVRDAFLIAYTFLED